MVRVAGLLLCGGESRAALQWFVALSIRQGRVVLPVADVGEGQAHGRSNQDILPVMLVVTRAGQGNHSCQEQG